MDILNLAAVYDSGGNRIRSLVQWDMNVKISIPDTGLTFAQPVHFFHEKETYAYVADSAISSGTVTATVPNAVLRSPAPIYGYIYATSGGESRSICPFRIPVSPRSQPGDYVYEDTTDYIYVAEALKEMRELAEKTGEAADIASSCAEELSGAVERINAFDKAITEETLRATGAESALNAQIGEFSAQLDAGLTDLERQLANVTIDPDDLGLEQDGETGYVYPTYQGVRSSNGIPLAASGGGGSSSGNNATLTATNTTGWLSATISAGASCVLSLNWSSTEDGLETGGGTLTVKVGNVTKASLNVAQGDVSVDVGPYLAAGTGKVKLTITDTYGNTRTITFTITVVALSISSSFDGTAAYAANEGISYTYTPVGSVEKTVWFILDGEAAGTSVVTASGRQQTFTLPAMEHGSHTLLVYFTAEVEGNTVRSNELYYDLIIVDSGETAVIIASAFRAESAVQYETLSIPYSVYTPNSLASAVELYADGDRVSALTVNRSAQTWTYRPAQAGSLTLAIVSGTARKEFRLEVAESEIDAKAETDSLSLYLSSYGRSNSEEDPSVWEYGDVKAVLTGFNFTSDGWIRDADGITALRVAGDARVEIPCRPFASDFRTTGKTLEIEFATSSVKDYDAVVMSCLSGGRGFSLTAQEARLASAQSSVSTQYKEDEHVRISFVCGKRSEDRLLMIYINGILSGAVQYPDDDDFQQINPAGITIGSDKCTVDIYCIRVYDNDLTRYQILDNWIADTQDAELMLARYSRNEIYDEYGSVVMEQLPADLPYLVISAAELPQYKGDKKTVSGYFVDPQDDSRSFAFTDASADVQGTSSQYYARKNYKIRFKGGFALSGGTVSEAFAIRPDAIPTDTFTFKADVASSEGANNVELVRLYNDACPYLTPAQENDSRIRQGIDGFPIVIFHDSGEEITFLGKYNFNNDKGTPEVYGFGDGDESWETLNNTSNRALWKSADYEGDDWQNDFESRYPEDYFDPSQLKSFAEWIVSTDTEAATGSTLPSSVTYDGIEYKTDTAEYRLAKFKAEIADYAELQSALFYYLFTELFLMVDSRVKNSFPSFIGEEPATAVKERNRVIT